tara:strand:- start:675 stop:863 length:189 start_codon:yes stop_codon:yes gene_type:complete
MSEELIMSRNSRNLLELQRIEPSATISDDGKQVHMHKVVFSFEEIQAVRNAMKEEIKANEKA